MSAWSRLLSYSKFRSISKWFSSRFFLSRFNAYVSPLSAEVTDPMSASFFCSRTFISRVMASYKAVTCDYTYLFEFA